MSDYTEGPWKMQVNGKTLTETMDGTYGVGIAICQQVRKPSTIPNARLIAAAPELLEALRKIVDMNRQHALDQYGDADKSESWSCVAIARAAIAKAEGR
jgi:hypothetical protein